MAQRRWTDEVNEQSKALFATLTTKQIRQRQDICNAQIALAFEQHKDDALADLERMQDALMREMMNRC